MQAKIREALQDLRERGCGTNVDGQAEYLSRATRRKQRQWLETVRRGQTTLHGRYRSVESEEVMAERARQNAERRMATAARAGAAAQVRKRTRQTTRTQGAGGGVGLGLELGDGRGPEDAQVASATAAPLQGEAGPRKRQRQLAQLRLTAYFSTPGPPRVAREPRPRTAEGDATVGTQRTKRQKRDRAHQRKRHREDGEAPGTLQRTTMRAKD